MTSIGQVSGVDEPTPGQIVGVGQVLKHSASVVTRVQGARLPIKHVVRVVVLMRCFRPAILLICFFL